jgi:hypothetical protein
MGVVGGDDDLVLVDGKRPHAAREDVVGVGRELLLVLPEQIVTPSSACTSPYGCGT